MHLSDNNSVPNDCCEHQMSNFHDPANPTHSVLIGFLVWYAQEQMRKLNGSSILYVLTFRQPRKPVKSNKSRQLRHCAYSKWGSTVGTELIRLNSTLGLDGYRQCWAELHRSVNLSSMWQCRLAPSSSVPDSTQIKIRLHTMSIVLYHLTLQFFLVSSKTKHRGETVRQVYF